MNADLIRGNLAQSGRVVRYACWPTITHQTVGEHSWQIARIYAAVFGRPSEEMAAFIQNHDSGELITGDPPFPVKRDNPDLKAACDRIEDEALAFLGVDLPQLELVDRARFKVCDLLEMMCYGMYERELGNLLAIPIIHRTEDAAWATAKAGALPLDNLSALEKYVRQEWHRHEQILRYSSPAPLTAQCVERHMERVKSWVSEGWRPA